MAKRTWRKNKKSPLKAILSVLSIFIVCAGIVYGMSKLPKEAIQSNSFLKELYYTVFEKDRETYTPLNLGPLNKIELEDGRVLYGPFQLKRVVDGDTLVVTNPDNTELTVRLIGIDTPESVHPDEERNSELGKIASDWLKGQFETTFNRVFYLEYDVTPVDKYGRTLAYVYLDDGGTSMLNRIIIESGYAVPLTIQPNSKHATDFVSDYEKAMIAGAGLWAETDLLPYEESSLLG